eukprot:TRINITY_DN12849_c0_g1_i2.p1 TRINITY_DN12849_c0_g1~~TRINITY_DN12849_c0_g1_i2.p1  ORF type:complete len:480 (+),score=142.38 TRINITY_DN12849_c0_g1_i2:56-1495(+)
MEGKQLQPDFVAALKAAAAVVHVPGGAESDRVLQTCSGDASRYPRAAPGAAVCAQSVDEVAAVVRLCSQHRVPVVPRGKGTGLEGGAIPTQGGVVVDTRLLNRIEILPNEAPPCARVGAGVLKDELDTVAEEYGLCFGPDPSANPSVGGMASTSGSGLTTLRYGTTRENVLAVECVLPDGSVLNTRRGPVRKSSSGYDLAQLLIGAEGTLGVITALTVRLWPRPTERCGALCGFSTTLPAAQAVATLLKAQLTTLTRCEFINAQQIEANNRMTVRGRLPTRPTLMLEFSHTRHREPCTQDAETARRIVAKHGAEGWTFAANASDFAALWAARRACYPAALRYRGTPGGDRSLATDVCVPLSQLPRVIDETERDFASVGVPCLICAHIADGNFHCLIPYVDDSEYRRAVAAEGRMIDRALEAGGTVSGEHGVGMGKVQKMAREHGDSHVAAQIAIKRALDPRNIMNPGKLFDPAAVSARL